MYNRTSGFASNFPWAIDSFLFLSHFLIFSFLSFSFPCFLFFTRNHFHRALQLTHSRSLAVIRFSFFVFR